MARIVLTALPAVLTDIGYRAGMILGHRAPSRTADARNAAEVAVAVHAFGCDVAAVNEGASFMVSATPARGARKFPGFDARDKADGFGGRRWMFHERDTAANATSRRLAHPAAEG